MRRPSLSASGRLLCAGVVLTALAVLSACGEKEKKPGQALASVNGEEITVLQLNEELQRSGVQAAQQEQAKRQLVESLIDRQLLLNEAAKEKLDRDPKVVQAVERAKALIVAQSYMQKRLGTPAKPTPAEVAAYFEQHPEFFARRKQIDMRELVIATADMTADLKAAMDAAKSLDEVAAWLDAHKVKFSRTQLSRTTAELPPELSTRLLGLPKGQLFIIKEGQRSLLISIADVRDAPVTLEQSTAQIEQFLFNKKNKDTADAELARLRAAAKIEYMDKTLAPVKGAAATPAASADSANARGVAGLK
ncbi:peptidyl-prolyl cis-trans isomerase, EpsD family [Rugamonas sp. FT81W]|uniref:peptidylprolyl isomerase n=1 Tax=Duganella vulcania TaxID=2692166 RepID=A0A845GXC4_9BURK|nr:peptidyl-prolyl cis-trans isomerase, EpsD family [Duganella vulcania]